jgi:hypothetical protein
VIIDAVLEAIGIPYGASVADGERYKDLLATRVMHLTVALKAMAEGRAAGWHLEYLRERLAECPIDYLQVRKNLGHSLGDEDQDQAHAKQADAVDPQDREDGS